MKKQMLLLLSLLLVLFLCLPGAAAAEETEIYVYDEAGLLAAEEWDSLNEAAARLAGLYDCGVYVVTVEDMADYIDPYEENANGETGAAAFSEYAWESLDLSGRHEGNGVMLMLSMADRDFDLLAHGDTANAAFTDYGKRQLQDVFLDDFRADDWYAGFDDFVSECGRYLEANAAGEPIDVPRDDDADDDPYEDLTFGERLSIAVPAGLRTGLPGGIVVGVVVAFIVCSSRKRKLKSVRKAVEAARYAVAGGSEITVREDRFTHTTETRVPIHRDDDNSSSSGGTSVNSGGYSHSSGKF